MRQDPTFKDIFAYPFMVEELLRWFVAGLPGGRELVSGLDFSRLLRVQEQSTAGPAQAKRAYANDLVWRIPFRKPGDDDQDRASLHLVLMIEVQGTVDHLMALRVRNYVDNHHMELWRGKRFGARDRLAPTLPIVIYTGGPPWTAATRVIDLVTPGVGVVGDLDLAARANDVFAGDGYVTLDTRRVAPDDLQRDNAASMLAGLCNPSLDRVPADVAALRARLDAPELRPLLEIVLLWAQQTARRTMDFELEVDDMAEVDRLHESGELEDYLAAGREALKDRYRAEGMEQGMEQGMERGLAQERDLLCRQAGRKFDARTAERLAGMLADIGDPNGLARVGDLIIDCASGEELIRHLDNGS